MQIVFGRMEEPVWMPTMDHSPYSNYCKCTFCSSSSVLNFTFRWLNVVYFILMTALAVLIISLCSSIKHISTIAQRLLTNNNSSVRIIRKTKIKHLCSFWFAWTIPSNRKWSTAVSTSKQTLDAMKFVSGLLSIVVVKYYKASHAIKN